MAGVINNLQDKRCPCGIVFTPNSGRQKYHSQNCPSRKQDAASKATAQARKPRARRAAVNGNGNGSNGHKPAAPEILVRLIRDCDQELEAIDAQLAEFNELQERRKDVARVRDTLASV